MTKLDRSLLDDAKRIYLQLKAERVQSPQERAEFLRKRAKFRLGSRVMLLGKYACLNVAFIVLCF